MRELGYRDALRDAMKGVGEGVGPRMEQEREEVKRIIEAAVEEVGKVFEDRGSAAVEPWLSTNEGEGLRIIFRKADGYDIKAFTVSIPVDAYPVTIRVRDREHSAANADELREKLKEVLKDPDVAAAAQYVVEQ